MNFRKDWKNILGKERIGRKLAIYILLFSSVVTLLSTALQLGLEYRRDVDTIKAEIAQVRDVYSQSLASSLWVTSKKDLQLQLDGIMRMPDMQYLEVISDTGEVQAQAGISRSDQTIAHEFPLHYTYRGKDLYLGKLRVEASLLGVYERLKNKVAVILITQGIKTFLVSFFILFLFQRLVGRHLSTLAQHFKVAHTEAVTQELSLDRKKVTDVSDDELDLLVGNINDNARRLKQAYQNLQAAAHAVQLEQKSLAITLNSIGDAVIATDVTGAITRMNPVAERLTGWSLSDALGQPLTTVFHIINAETRLRVANPVELVLENGQVVGQANHTALLGRDGHEHQIADSAAPIRDSTDAIVGVVLVFSDVTEKYRTEASLRVAKDHLQTTLNAIPDLLFEVDASGCVLSYHAHRSDLLAAPPEVFMGRRFSDVLPPAAAEVCMNALKEAADKGWSTGSIYALPLPQGETWFELSAAAMPVVAGAVPRFILLTRDITTRKRTDEALRANKDRLNFLLSSSPAIIYTCEAKPPYAATYISENITELMGFHPDQFTGTPGFWADHIHPEDSQRVFDNLGELFVHGHHDLEYRFRMADGTYHWIFDRVKVVYSTDGEPEQLIGYWADIDDMKRVEADLRKSEESHRELFESNPHPMWVFDLETLAFIAVNDAAIRHYGYSRDEFMAMTIKDIRPPEDVPRLLDNLALVSEGIDEAGFWNHCTKDGRVITVEIVSHTLKFDGRNAELVLAHDVTERKLAELALKVSNARLQLLETCVSRLNDIILITEAEPFSEPGPRIVFVNDAFMRRTGFSREEVIGKSPRLLQGPKTDRMELDRIRAAMERWEPVRAELLNYSKSGQEFWIELDIVPVADATGWFTHWVAVERDVTERKQNQIDLQTSLREKTALLLEVQHRVKNNLQVITSLLRLESFRSTHAPTKTVLQDMQGRVRSMALLHETIYRKDTFAAIDLGSYVGQIASESLKSMQVNSGAVRLQLDMETLQVGLDQATPAGMLVSELVSNCLKHAFQEGYTGEIGISLHPLPELGQWRLRVSDSGIGLPADFEDRRKTSLGLQLAGDMATQMKGTLHVGSGPQAVFTVDFKAEVPAALVINLDGAKQ